MRGRGGRAGFFQRSADFDSSGELRGQVGHPGLPVADDNSRGISEYGFPVEPDPGFGDEPEEDGDRGGSLPALLPTVANNDAAPEERAGKGQKWVYTAAESSEYAGNAQYSGDSQLSNQSVIIN